ncbi:MAG TPA: hypothetical protein VHW23_03945 [Kofleriaceae bacterium]|jgi:hypothetical protein|nr:hypothetical protein [Kofleriaceae bacterium]
MEIAEIKRGYGAAVRKQLRHYPVWDVGRPIQLGDFGTVDDNCFTKLGNIVDEYEATPEPEPAASPAPWDFKSEGTRDDDHKVEASATGTATASLVVTFSAAFSLYIRAPSSMVLAMRNIAAVARQIENVGKQAAVPWRGDYCFVAGLRRTPCLTLLVSTQASSTMKLTGDTTALEALRIGKAAVTAGIQTSGDSGLTSVGQDAAVYVDLIKLSWFGKPVPKSAGEIYEWVDPAL